MDLQKLERAKDIQRDLRNIEAAIGSEDPAFSSALPAALADRFNNEARQWLTEEKARLEAEFDAL